MKWKTINGWPKYSVSNNGLVKRRGKILSIFLIKGYQSVNLSNGNYRISARIHRLVATAFVENKDNKNIVNHIDGNKLNNSHTNLEWCTSSENELHSYNTLRKRHPMTKIERSEHPKIIKRFRAGEKQIAIAKEYGVSKQQIWNIVNGYRQQR